MRGGFFEFSSLNSCFSLNIHKNKCFILIFIFITTLFRFFFSLFIFPKMAPSDRLVARRCEFSFKIGLSDKFFATPRLVAFFYSRVFNYLNGRYIFVQ